MNSVWKGSYVSEGTASQAEGRASLDQARHTKEASEAGAEGRNGRRFSGRQNKELDDVGPLRPW